MKSRLNEDVNEEWISDKTRLPSTASSASDWIKPWSETTARESSNRVTWAGGSWRLWPEALARWRAQPDESGRWGTEVDGGGVRIAEDLFNRLGCDNTECRQDGVRIDPSVRSDYLMNPTIPGIEDADNVLLVGCNPRMEAPILNARLRKSFLFGTSVSYIGNPMQMNYDCQQVGTSATDLVALAEGTHPFSEELKNSENPMILVGMSALIGPDAPAVKAAINKLSSQLPGKENAIGYV
eukprot:TRINITY_DN915_c0_g2_i2.p1 TRINITY_DN915_c0_g2~~TRINITY_DN915_c0_g2_i2.p1  ORF type:complete len:252 (-),score=53.79 TRINITY_DN915_c0_g2_i2:59-775(-)